MIKGPKSGFQNKLRINNGFNSLRRILKLPSSSSSSSSHQNQVHKQPGGVLDTPPMTHRSMLSKQRATNTLEYSRSMHYHHQPPQPPPPFSASYHQHQQHQQPPSSSSSSSTSSAVRNMFTMTLNRHVGGGCGLDRHASQDGGASHKATGKKKDAAAAAKLKKQMSFSAVSSSTMKVDMVAGNSALALANCASGRHATARSVHSMSLNDDDSLSNVNQPNQVSI